ncbi:MAG: hypothetical protein K2H15_02735, partial [Muribaculaceae bacterium]|nr:hypothetical protein [Muribaculaceae bacterium]
LEGVTVTAEKVFMKENTITLFPSKRDRRFASGGIDVIRNMNIPEVSVDPITKELKTSGGEGIAMFVDYVPASKGQVGNLRPQDIERIDILYYPDDPRFQGAKVAANYVMRRYEYGGYTKADLYQNFPADGTSGSLYSKFSVRRMTYDIAAGIKHFRQGNETGTDEHSVYRFSSGVLERNSVTDYYKSRSLYPDITGRILYNSGNVSISNSVGLNYSRINPLEKGAAVTFSDIFNSSRSVSAGSKRRLGIVWDGNYFFTLPGSMSLTFEGNFRWGHNHNNSSYTLEDYEPIMNDIAEDTHQGKGNVTLQKRIGRHSFDILIGGVLKYNSLNYLSSSSTDVDYREYYGLVSLSSQLRFGKFTISPCMSVVYSNEKINGEAICKWFPQPFIPFYLQIGRRQSLNGAFNFSIGFPDNSSRNPVLVRSNEVDAVRGNENLATYRFYNARLGYSHHFADWLRTRLDASLTVFDNCLVPVYSEEVSPEGTPMMVCGRMNDGRWDDLRIALSLSGMYFNQALQVNLTAAARNFRQRGMTRRDVWNPELTAYATYYIGDFMLSGYYALPFKSHSVWGDSRYPSYYNIAAGWSWNDLFVQLALNNPFRKSYVEQRTEIVSPLYTSSRVTRNNTYHRSISLTLSYSFGYGKKVDRNNEIRKMDGAESIILQSK